MIEAAPGSYVESACRRHRRNETAGRNRGSCGSCGRRRRSCSAFNAVHRPGREVRSPQVLAAPAPAGSFRWLGRREARLLRRPLDVAQLGAPPVAAVAAGSTADTRAGRPGPAAPAAEGRIWRAAMAGWSVNQAQPASARLAGAPRRWRHQRALAAQALPRPRWGVREPDSPPFAPKAWSASFRQHPVPPPLASSDGPAER